LGVTWDWFISSFRNGSRKPLTLANRDKYDSAVEVFDSGGTVVFRSEYVNTDPTSGHQGGLLAPGGTSPAIVNRIHAEVGRILAVPEVQATLRDQGWTTAHVPVADMTRQIHDGRREWKVVTERAGIRME